MRVSLVCWRKPSRQARDSGGYRSAANADGGLVGTDQIVVHDDPDEHRYVVEVDGELAGLTVYHRRGGRHFFVHTEIREDFEGQGLGSALARGALVDVVAQGRPIVPLCTFIAGWIQRHPAYLEFVDHEMLAEIDAEPAVAT